ncbi:NAD(P)H-hydrate dehydratase [Halobacteria archaeon AArc-dxtr1]|nr:NAD(P)H-hydrate dehydratase [Halobacteria archaeon AArc-dxtr1]
MGRLQRTLSNVASEHGDGNGRVGMVGGSVAYPNQPTIVGLAALRAGSDHVRTLVAAEIYDAVASASSNLLVDRFVGERFDGEAAEAALEMAAWADVLVVGPGLVDAESAAIRRTIDETDCPTVVDALAIEPGLEADLSQAVLTPSEREDDAIKERYGSIEAFTEETGAVVALTGEVDEIVVDGQRLQNETGTSALTVAGTGDTLAGIVAALLGQGADRETAAELGAWILGKSGELATAEYGAGVVATDVIARIPDTMR